MARRTTEWSTILLGAYDLIFSWSFSLAVFLVDEYARWHDMVSHCVLERAEWFTIPFYYKLDTFKCMHKAYNGRLPSTLTNCIAKKRNLSYSIRACHSLLVPRFNIYVLWRTSLHIEALSFRTCCLPNTLTLLTQAFVTLWKSLQLLIFLRSLNLTFYQPRLLVLNMKILYIIEIKLIFLCLIVSFDYA